jgi:hypothetical protein
MHEIISEAERLINSGWTERRGPFEPKPVPVHETLRGLPGWSDDT